MAAVGQTNLGQHSFLAGILGMVQALLYAIMSILPAVYYYQAANDQDKLGIWFTVAFIEEFLQGLKALIVIMVALNLIWAASSLELVIYSFSKSSCLVRQWVIVTTITIVTGLIGSSYFLFQAVPHFDKKHNVTLSNETSYCEQQPECETGQFIYLYVSLSNGTILFWILNIVLCVYVHKRAKEIQEESKVAPGFAAAAIGSDANRPSLLRSGSPQSHQQGRISNSQFYDKEGPSSLNRGYGDSARDLRRYHHNGVNDSSILNRDNRFGPINGDSPRLGVPMAHLGVSPFKGSGAPSSSSYDENDDEGYDVRYGSPPSNMDDSERGGGDNPNFVMKRKSLYNYENNPAEIQNRMSKLEMSDSTRRSQQPNPISAKLKPPIYQATAFEPQGRNNNNHAPLTRTSGIDRQSGYNNLGYVSQEDDIRGSHGRALNEHGGPSRPTRDEFRGSPRPIHAETRAPSRQSRDEYGVPVKASHDEFREPRRLPNDEPKIALRPAQDQIRSPLRLFPEDIRASQRRANEEIRDFHQRRMSNTPERRAYEYDNGRYHDFQRQSPETHYDHRPRTAFRHPEFQDRRGYATEDRNTSHHDYDARAGYESNSNVNHDYNNSGVATARRY